MRFAAASWFDFLASWATFGRHSLQTVNLTPLLAAVVWLAWCRRRALSCRLAELVAVLPPSCRFLRRQHSPQHETPSADQLQVYSETRLPASPGPQVKLLWEASPFSVGPDHSLLSGRALGSKRWCEVCARPYRHWRADRLQFGKSLWPNNKRRQALNHFVDTDSLPAFDAEDPQAEPMNADCWKLPLLGHWAVCRAAHPATPPTPAAR